MAPGTSSRSLGILGAVFDFLRAVLDEIWLLRPQVWGLPGSRRQGLGMDGLTMYYVMTQSGHECYNNLLLP